jgi:hypothetical protein
MRILRLALIGSVGLLLLALLPVAGSAAPVHGQVTKCLSTATCSFVFNTTAGTGWATTTSTLMSFQLPGEAKASHNLSYGTYTARLTGTYTYWTIGNFVGTDVNTGKVVFGSTSTNFTITAHCHRGCSYNYTTDNGTIVFHFTHSELTSTSVSCTPSSIPVATKTTCTATVTDLWNSSNHPTGKVSLSSGGLGAFSTTTGSCTLKAGTCSLTWSPFDNTVGKVTISATYAGYSGFYKSSGSGSVTVTGGD